MSDDYALLAPIYKQLGLADFAEAVTPQVINFAQSGDWVGRRIVDLGCGTGASVRWFASHGYNVTGIDLSPSMLKVAQELLSGNGLAFQLYEGDARALKDLHDIDLFIAFDLLNEMNNLRDLEGLFSSVAALLAPDKLFVFDLQTIEGLAEGHGLSSIACDSDELTVLVTHQFDFDRQASTDDYLIFQHNGSAWERQHTTRSVRGFPVQVVAALLQRAGFGIMTVMNSRFETIDPATIHGQRVIFFARKARLDTE